MFASAVLAVELQAPHFLIFCCATQVGFNHGSSAIQSEKLTDAQIKDEALRALATMVPAGEANAVG